MKFMISILAALLLETAGAAVIPFTGSGLVAPTGPPDAGNNLPLAVVQVPPTAYTLDGASGWQLISNFTSNLVTGTGSGTFHFFRGADSLSGTLTAGFGPAPGQFALAYLIQAGTGNYLGTAGSGTSIVQLLGDPNSPPTPFSETGTLNAVPEPASIVLVAMALVSLTPRKWSRTHRLVSDRA